MSLLLLYGKSGGSVGGVTLQGNLLEGTVGLLGVSQAINLNIVGNTLSAIIGDLTVSSGTTLNINITGVTLSSAISALGISQNVGINPTGVALAGYISSFTTTQTIGIAITGNTINSNIGSLLQAFNIGVTGNLAILTVGDLAKSIRVGVTGVTGGFNVGDVVAGSIYNIDISGVSLTALLGEIAANSGNIDLDAIYKAVVHTVVQLVEDKLVITVETTYNVNKESITNNVVTEEATYLVVGD